MYKKQGFFQTSSKISMYIELTELRGKGLEKTNVST